MPSNPACLEDLVWPTLPLRLHQPGSNVSRVYFETDEHETELWGGERAWIGSLCGSRFKALASKMELETMRRASPEDAWFRGDSNHLKRNFLLWCSRPDPGEKIRINGEWHDLFSVQINTVLSDASAPMRLLTKIHGVCEIHGWIAKGNLSWAVELLEEARARSLARSLPSNTGTWEDVLTMLRDASSPVVLSYSVCDRWDGETLRPDVEISPQSITPDPSVPTLYHLMSEEWEARIEEQGWNAPVLIGVDYRADRK